MALLQYLHVSRAPPPAARARMFVSKTSCCLIIHKSVRLSALILRNASEVSEARSAGTTVAGGGQPPEPCGPFVFHPVEPRSGETEACCIPTHRPSPAPRASNGLCHRYAVPRVKNNARLMLRGFASTATVVPALRASTEVLYSHRHHADALSTTLPILHRPLNSFESRNSEPRLNR